MNQIIAWVEIPTTNFESAVQFYNNVFNFELTPLDWGEEKMACLPNDEGALIYSKGYEPSQQGVLVSFQAQMPIDQHLVKVEENGGKILKAKTKIEAEGRGYFAVFTDCEGNRIGLYGDR